MLNLLLVNQNLNKKTLKTKGNIDYLVSCYFLLDLGIEIKLSLAL